MISYIFFYIVKVKYKDFNIECSFSNISIAFPLWSLSCALCQDFIIICQKFLLFIWSRNIVSCILIEKIQILIFFDALFSLPLKNIYIVVHTAKTFAKWTIKYSKITEGTSSFSHLNILFIPHIAMASHFSVSPRTAGKYDSIKAHESID